MGKSTDPPTSSGQEEPEGFDQRLARLEAIVAELEEGGLGLEPAIERYQAGIVLLKDCHAVLGRYRSQVEELSAEAEGTLASFEDDPDVSGSADE